MPQGNTYPAPSLPLTGAEQFIIFQQAGSGVATCTLTVAQFLATLSSEGNGVAYGASGTGSGAADGYKIASSLTVFTAVPANSAATLPTGAFGVPVQPGNSFRVLNYGGALLSVYPPAGHTIMGQAVNTPVQTMVGASTTFTYVAPLTWVAF